MQLSFCNCRFAVVVLQLSFCNCSFAIVILHVSFCNCRFAVVFLQLSFCNCRFAIVVVQLSFCNCYSATVVLQLSFCNCRFAIVVLQLSFCKWNTTVETKSAYSKNILKTLREPPPGQRKKNKQNNSGVKFADPPRIRNGIVSKTVKNNPYRLRLPLGKNLIQCGQESFLCISSRQTFIFTVAFFAPFNTTHLFELLMEQSKRNENSDCDRRQADRDVASRFVCVSV